MKGACHVALNRSSWRHDPWCAPAEGLSAEIEALEVGEGRRLTGQLVPPQAGQVEVDHPGGHVRVEANEMGCFVADDVRRGPVRLRYRGGDGRIFETPWVVV